MRATSNLAIWAAFLANVGIAAAKFFAAALTGSAAMLSEALHSTVDSTNELFLLYGEHRSKRPPDEAHPFGHGHALYFWTLIVAINVFGIGGGLSLWEGSRKILFGETLTSATWAYAVLGLAFVFEGSSLWIGVRQLRRTARGRSPWRQLRETKQPKVLAVVLEDSAALAGLVVAFCGVFFSHLLRLAWIDGLASVVIGLLLGGVAFLLGREAKGLLLGEGAESEVVEHIRRIAEAEHNLAEVRRALTLQLGPGDVLLNMDVRFAPGLNAQQVAQTVARLKRALREAAPELREIFIEGQVLPVEVPASPPAQPADADAPREAPH